MDSTQMILLWTAIAFLTNGLAWRLGFFALPKQKTSSNIRIWHVLAVFFLFLGVQLALTPFLFQLFSFSTTDRISQGWWNIFSICSSTLAVLIYFLSHDASIKEAILGKERQIWRPITLGILSWALCYPVVVALSQFLSSIMQSFFQIEPTDQVAVQFLKEMRFHPPLFYLSAFLIIFVVPLIEELLFRGFLQNWCVKQFGLFWGICLTSLIFALFHYAPVQGWHNLELLLSLLILSGYLGFLYEREQTLIAPIALHSTINGISLLILLFLEN